ncbi:MAG TPA: septal ring lytic transglycosylase RlpA family protein [Terriglobales bacterium]|nr:septal ring lytic transglycosylase RlpA family protein [Terriglobales bacterium]
MQARIAHVAAIVALVVAGGAAQGPTKSITANVQPQTAKPINVVKPHIKPYQVGTASWYGDYFEGKQTASGEPFNMYDLTAAHPTLPLGTMVKVTNLRNHRAVVVKINDRGPVVPGRIIDLSYSAAQALQFKNKGLQTVRLDVVHPDTVAMLEPVAFQR